MLRRAALALVLLVAVPAAVTRATAHAADIWGSALGELAVSGAAALTPARRALVFDARDWGPLPSTLVETSAPRATGKAMAKSGRKKPVPARGVFVPASTILNLARAGVIPHAVLVPAEGARPAGLRLAGVSGMGTGMRDGDVLTRVAGAPVSSVAAVGAIVMRARERRAAQISAEFWRNGERWTLTVEQPYPR